MKKIMIGIAAVVASVGMVMSYAATQSTGKVLADNVALDKDLEVFQDYSDYPGTVGQVGKIVRFYDFASQGGAAGSTIKLLPAIKVKDNTVIRDGYIKVLTAIAPVATVTNSFGINSAVDLVATGTNLMNVADTFRAIVPVGTVATYVQATNDLYVTMTIGSTAITNGKVMVVLDCEVAP
jgi:hypothetical protein